MTQEMRVYKKSESLPITGKDSRFILSMAYFLGIALRTANV